MRDHIIVGDDLSREHDFDKSVVAVLNYITLPPPPEGLGETITLTFETEL